MSQNRFPPIQSENQLHATRCALMAMTGLKVAIETDPDPTVEKILYHIDTNLELMKLNIRDYEKNVAGVATKPGPADGKVIVTPLKGGQT